MQVIREFIRGHVEMAKHFEGLVARDKRFELVFPRNFAMVCFMILSEGGNGDLMT